MTSSSRDTRTPQQSEYLAAARLEFCRLMTRRGKANKLVPKIRDYLKQAGLDASALSLDGKSSADEMEKVLSARLEEFLSQNPRAKTR